MATKWLDPYMEASVGGIHGTTDTATRDGSYAAPYALEDFITTSSSGMAPPSGLTSGDELRIKGLALSSFMVGSYRGFRDASTHDAESFSDFDSALHTQMSAENLGQSICLEFDDGVIGSYPLYVMSDSYTSDGSTDHQIGIRAMDSLLDAMASDGTAATCTISIVDDQYHIPRTSYTTSTTVYFCAFDTTTFAITVTAGWTSETVQGGVSLLPIDIETTSSHTFHVGFIKSPVVWDADGLHFAPCNPGASSGSFSARLYFGANYTSDTTHKIGSIGAISATTALLYAGLNSVSAGVKVHCEIGAMFGQTITAYLRGDLTIRNIHITSSMTYYSNDDASRLIIGTATSSSSVPSSPATGTLSSIQFLDSGYHFCRSAVSIIASQVSVTYGSSLKTSLTGFNNSVSNAMIAPASRLITNKGLIAGSADMVGDQPFLIFDSGSANGSNNRPAFVDAYLGEANFGGGDYQATASKMVWKTSVSNTHSDPSSGLLTVDTAFFQTNDHDGKPLIAMCNRSDDDDPCALAYNDGDALVLQSNSLCNNQYFLTRSSHSIPSFTTEDIRVTVNAESVGSWTGTTRFYAVYFDENWGQVVSLIGTHSSGGATDYALTIANASIGSGSTALTVVYDFQSDDAESKRVKVNSVTVEAV